jgi:hypothetical protein
VSTHSNLPGLWSLTLDSRQPLTWRAWYALFASGEAFGVIGLLLGWLEGSRAGFDIFAVPSITTCQKMTRSGRYSDAFGRVDFFVTTQDVRFLTHLAVTSAHKPTHCRVDPGRQRASRRTPSPRILSRRIQRGTISAVFPME